MLGPRRRGACHYHSPDVSATAGGRASQSSTRMLPIEFTVPGPPVSYQTNVRSRLRIWEAKVRNAARACVPRGALPVNRSGLMLTLVYYHEHPTVRIDNDNLL